MSNGDEVLTKSGKKKIRFDVIGLVVFSVILSSCLFYDVIFSRDLDRNLRSERIKAANVESELRQAMMDDVRSLRSEVQDLKRDMKNFEWRIEREVREMIRDHTLREGKSSGSLNHKKPDDEAMIEVLEDLPFGKSFAETAESLPEIDWGFLEIDTSAHEAELENALRERMSADEWAEREAAKIEETRWNEYFENAAPEEERALFSESVERRFAAFMETYAAIEKANRSDDLGDDFENDPEIEAAFAMSKKQMLEIIRADVAAQIRRQNGLIEKDGQVISDPDQAIGDVRLRTDYFVEMQKRQTMKHLEESLANESELAESAESMD